MGKKATLTADEIIATLNHSTLPTILVEGPDDRMICRWLELFIPWQIGDPLPCGGREKLLQIYKRRSELRKANTVFLADQDMYLFTAIPEDYQGGSIVWTSGYSIENDIYASTSKIDDLLAANEQTDYQAILAKVIAWFAFEVEEYRSGREHKVDSVKIRERDKDFEQQLTQGTLDPKETYLIINRHNTGISLELRPRQPYQSPSPQLVQEITADFKLRVRGKTLFDILACYLDDKKRTPRHRKEALYEIGAKLIEDNRYMNRLVTELKKALKRDENGVTSTPTLTSPPNHLMVT